MFPPLFQVRTGYLVLFFFSSVLTSYLWIRFQDTILEYSTFPSYSARILSYDPLIIYLEGFISKPERTHLLQLGEGRYNRSRLQNSTSREYVSDYRTSSTVVLSDDDVVVRRVVSRASSFQGFSPQSNYEPLQLTRYNAGQQFREHWDHIQGMNVPENTTQRITTIFAVLEATCEECGTRFPLIAIDWSREDQRWCKFVDCNDKTGITIRPIPGNAVFWKNLNSTGGGDYKTLHAGLPPLNGTKTGLNIWAH